MPVFSVVMPAWRCAGYLGEALRSALEQTLTDLEIIVILDPCEDGTREILLAEAARDVRIVPVQNASHKGLAESRNIGIQKARGEFVAFLDADDLWLPDKLEKQLAAFRTTGVALCCTSYSFVDKESSPLKKSYIIEGPVDFSLLLRENVIGTSTCAVQCAVAQAYRMDSSYFHEDYVYWLSILRSGTEGIALHEPLARYRVLPDSRSRDKFNTARHRWIVYRRFLRFGIMRSLYYFSCYVVRAVRKYR